MPIGADEVLHLLVICRLLIELDKDQTSVPLSNSLKLVDSGYAPSDVRVRVIPT